MLSPYSLKSLPKSIRAACACQTIWRACPGLRGLLSWESLPRMHSNVAAENSPAHPSTLPSIHSSIHSSVHCNKYRGALAGCRQDLLCPLGLRKGRFSNGITATVDLATFFLLYLIRLV